MAIGVSSGIFANTYYKTSASEPGQVNAKLGQKIKINDFVKEQNINFPWVSKGEFNLVSRAKVQDELVTIDNLVTYDKSEKAFTFNAMAEGEVTLSSLFDNTVIYKFNFVTDFSSKDVKKVIQEQFVDFFEDNIVTKEELAIVNSINILDFITFDGSDLALLPNLNRISIDGDDRITKFSAFNAPKGTKIYVPKEDYDEYVTSAYLGELEEYIFAEISSPSKLSIMLFKNGGNLIGGTASSFVCVELNPGDAYIDLPTEDDISILGNRFLGWEDKQGNPYSRKTAFNRDTKLYAKWEEKIYRVKYHIQDNVSKDIVKEYKYNDALEIIKDSEIPTLDDPNYIFIGWSKTADGAYIDYSAGQRVDNYFNDDSRLEVHLYGVWAYRTFKIQIYNDVELVKTVNCTYGTSINLPNDGEIAGIGQYTGLTTVKGSKVIEYEPGETIQLVFNAEGEHGYVFLRRTSGDDTLVLYAVFMPINFPINYYKSQSDTQPIHIQQYSIDGQDSSGLITNNNPVTFLTNMSFDPSIIEVTGYHFIGWVREYMGTKTLFTNKTIEDTTVFDEIIQVNQSWQYDAGFDGKSEVSLYPAYEANKILLSFEANITDATRIYENAVVKYDRDQAFVFTGSCEATGKSLMDVQVFNTKLNSKYQITPAEIRTAYVTAFSKLSGVRHSSLPNNQITVYLQANFVINVYIVAFNTKGGNTISAQSVDYGKTATRPTDPTRDGYDFVDWYTTESYTTKYDFSTKVTKSFTIYAKWSEKPKDDGPSCFLEGTLVTLANGTTKPVEELTFGDQLLTWDFFTGQYVPTSIILIEDRVMNKKLIDLTFDNGVVFNAVTSHSLFSLDQMRFVKITPENAEDFIGESFFFVDGPHKLVEVKTGEGVVRYFGIITSNTFTCIANGALNSVSQTIPLQNIAPITSDMKYDLDVFNSYIELYGLASYEEFEHLISKEMYDAFNGDYIYIAMNVCGLSMDNLYYLIDLYYRFGGNL